MKNKVENCFIKRFTAVNAQQKEENNSSVLDVDYGYADVLRWQRCGEEKQV
jgi:hypothetical protein